MSSWLRDLDFRNYVTTEERARAGEAMRQLGTNALPRILEDLCVANDAESRFSKLLRHRLPKIGALQLHIPSPNDRRWRAFDAMRALGVTAAAAAPILVERMHGPPPGAYMCALSLAYIGSDGLPPLLGALTNQNPAVRLAAVDALRYRPADAAASLPMILSKLNDSDKKVRQMAARVLSDIRGDAAHTVPVMAEHLRTSTDFFVRIDLVRAMARYGVEATPAVPVLKAVAQEHQHSQLNMEASAVVQTIEQAARSQ